MKTKNVFCVLMLILLFGCSKDDDPQGPDPNPDPMGNPDPDNRPPSGFSLLSVENNDVDVEPVPEFKWEMAIDPDGDSVRYDLYVDENPDPSNRVAEDLTVTSFNLSNSQALSLVRDHYWKVVAKDDKGGETSSEVFTFATRRLVNAQEIEVIGSFGNRDRHASAVFNDVLWVLGGFAATDVVSNITAVSSDKGKIWGRLVTTEDSGQFTPRFYHDAAVFDGKIWIVGGNGENGFFNDSWSIVDNIWMKVNQIQEYLARAQHTLTTHEGKLWIIGGATNGGVQLADVWSSTDGATWQNVTNEAGFGKRSFHQTVSFQGKLWVIGGTDDNEAKNDVWSSDDGISWERITANAEFSARTGHKALVFNNKIWIVGGGGKNDIWYSEDGMKWIDATPLTSFPIRDGFTALFYDNGIYMLGGSNTDEVWVIDYHNFVN